MTFSIVSPRIIEIVEIVDSHFDENFASIK